MKRAEDRMSPAEVGALLGVAENTLAQWRSTRRGPAWYKIGSRAVYYRPDVEAWMETRRADGTQGQSRQVAIPLPRPRTGRVRKHRLGGYRTQQEKSRADGERTSASDPGGALGLQAADPARVQ